MDIFNLSPPFGKGQRLVKRLHTAWLWDYFCVDINTACVWMHMQYQLESGSNIQASREEYHAVELYAPRSQGRLKASAFWIYVPQQRELSTRNLPRRPCVLLSVWFRALVYVLLCFSAVNQLPSGTIMESEERRHIRKREAGGKMRPTNRRKDMWGSKFTWSLSLCTVNELIQVQLQGKSKTEPWQIK